MYREQNLKMFRDTVCRVSDVQVPPNRRGRRAGATREEVLRLAMHRYLRGARVDVSELAAELELGRSTVYRWFSSRDELIGEVLVRAAEPLLERARADARGTGAAALGDALDRFNRSLVDAPALRRFIDREPEAAVRIIISSTGKVQPRIVELVTGLIRRLPARHRSCDTRLLDRASRRGVPVQRCGRRDARRRRSAERRSGRAVRVRARARRGSRW